MLCHLCQRCSVNMPLLVTTCLLQLPLGPRSQVSLPSDLTFHQPPHTLSTHTPSPCGILTRQNPNPSFMQTPVHSMAQCGNPSVTVASNIPVPFLPAMAMQPIPFNTCYLPAQGLPASRSITFQKLLPPPNTQSLSQAFSVASTVESPGYSSLPSPLFHVSLHLPHIDSVSKSWDSTFQSCCCFSSLP